MKVKVGLGQLNPKLGDIETNLELHLKKISEAADQGVELLAFPELSLTGYRLCDLLYDIWIRSTPQDPAFKGKITTCAR
jgi:predicted amidohydrolase